jgi:hypothetical protein
VAQPTIQTSFASGEWAPKLRSRVDIAKYKTGAAQMRNFFVDWSGGGASTRQGTKYIAQCAGLGARLVPFTPTASLAYVLEFGQNYIRFYNNGAQIMSGGLPYQISSPYNVNDLFPNAVTGNPGLKWCQDVTSMILTHPNYPPQILTIISPTNWTLNAISFGSTIGITTGGTVTTTLTVAANNWNYAYQVTAVDVNGQEGPPSLLGVLAGALANTVKSLSDTANPGTITVTWSSVSGAASYNVYKASPIFNALYTAGAPTGFIGNTTALTFLDATPGFAPDFSQTPPVAQNPFMGSGVASVTVTGSGAPLASPVPTVSIAAPPAGGTPAVAFDTAGVTSASVAGGGGGYHVGDLLYRTDGGMGGSIIVVNAIGGGGTVTGVGVQYPGAIGGGSTIPTNPVFPSTGFGVGCTLNLNWGIVSVGVSDQGTGYTSVPTVTFSAGGASATANLGAASAGNPGVAAFFQERLVFGAQAKNVQDFNMSQTGNFFNFNTSFPAQADDAISGQIISDDLNTIRSFINVPSGLITLTAKSAWLLSGGGGGLAASNPVTPASIIASQQAFNGASDLRPLKINLDILYATYKGGYVRDLTYNFYQNIYAGADITTLSNHLFFGTFLVDWCWAEEPFKTVWVIRQDGQLLSLAYVKDQELIGWAHHDTNGQFLSCCSISEFNIAGESVDAVYLIVQRFVNGAYVQYVERMADRYFFWGYEDSWCVDAGLQTAPYFISTTTNSVLTVIGDASTVGSTVTLVDGVGAPFTAPMAAANWLVRMGGAIYKITGFTSASTVTATVQRIPFGGLVNMYSGLAQPITYIIYQPVTSVSGLGHLAGLQVVGVADGQAVGPLTVSGGGTVTLPFAAGKVTLGLVFTCILQTLPLDLGEPTVQGKRKKITAVTVRVADTLGLQIGTSIPTVVPMKDFVIGNLGSQSNTVVGTNGDLVNGDGRTVIDQVWQEAGNYLIGTTGPYPATILGVMPEVVVGDTPEERRGG